MNHSTYREGDVKGTGPAWLLSVCAGAVTLGLGLLCALVVPSFRVMFDDLGEKLPAATQALVSIPSVAWIAIGALLSAALLVKNLHLPKSASLLIDVVSLVGSGIFLVVLVMALFLPLTGIIKSIK